MESCVRSKAAFGRLVCIASAVWCVLVLFCGRSEQPQVLPIPWAVEMASTVRLTFEKALLLPSESSFTTTVFQSGETGQGVLASLARKRLSPGVERRMPLKALSCHPLPVVALIALAGVLLLRLSQRGVFPLPLGLRGIVHYALPPPACG